MRKALIAIVLALTVLFMASCSSSDRAARARHLDYDSNIGWHPNGVTQFVSVNPMAHIGDTLYFDREGRFVIDSIAGGAQ